MRALKASFMVLIGGALASGVVSAQPMFVTFDIGGGGNHFSTIAEAAAQLSAAGIGGTAQRGVFCVVGSGGCEAGEEAADGEVISLLVARCQKCKAGR